MKQWKVQRLLQWPMPPFRLQQHALLPVSLSKTLPLPFMLLRLLFLDWLAMIAARLGVSRLQLRLQPLRMLVLLAQTPPFGLVWAMSARGQLRLRVPRAGAYTWQNLLQQ